MFRARAVWWVVVALGCGAARGGADLHAGLFEPPRGVSAGVPRGMFAEPLAGHSRRVHEALVRGHGRGDDVTAECAGRLAHLRDLVASGEYHEAVELSFALEKETAWPAGCVVDEALVTTGDVLVKVSTSLDRTTSNKTVLVDVGGGSANAPKWLPLLHAHPAANATGAHAFAGAAKDASLVGFTLDGVFVASESPLRCAAAAAGASVVCSHGVTKGAPFVRHGYADADTALEASLVPARRNAALKRPAGLGSSRLVDATTSYVTGAKTLLLVPVCPRDYPCGSRWTGLAFSDPDAYFQGIATAYEAFLAKNSWGVATMTIEVAPTVEIDYDHDRCGTYEALGQLSNDAAALDTMAYAAAEAYDAGFAISNFDFRAILLPNCGSFGWSGLGYVGAVGFALNIKGYSGDNSLAHEIGHNYGAFHASFNNYKGTRGSVAWWTIDGPNWVEYANPYTIMGQFSGPRTATDWTGHYLVAGKIVFDWIGTSHYTQVVPHDSVSGDGRCAPCGPYELQASDDGTLSAHPVAIVVHTQTANRYLFVEYRKSFGGAVLTFSDVMNGGQTGYYGNTVLVDCAPATTTLADALLSAGSEMVLDLGTEANQFERFVTVTIGTSTSSRRITVEILASATKPPTADSSFASWETVEGWVFYLSEVQTKECYTVSLGKGVTKTVYVRPTNNECRDAVRAGGRRLAGSTDLGTFEYSSQHKGMQYFYRGATTACPRGRNTTVSLVESWAYFDRNITLAVSTIKCVTKLVVTGPPGAEQWPLDFDKAVDWAPSAMPSPAPTTARPSDQPSLAPSVNEACPVNQFGPGLQKPELCFDCPAGTFTGDVEGGFVLSDCASCEPGRFNANGAGLGCPICPRGTFTATFDAAQLLNCSFCAPQTASGLGASGCSACAGGGAGVGFGSCIDCDLDSSNACPNGPNGVACSGRGNCTFGACVCDACFSGADCATCANGCDCRADAIFGFSRESTVAALSENSTRFVNLTLVRTLATTGSAEIILDVSDATTAVPGRDYDEANFPITVHFQDGVGRAYALVPLLRGGSDVAADVCRFIHLAIRNRTVQAATSIEGLEAAATIYIADSNVNASGWQHVADRAKVRDCLAHAAPAASSAALAVIAKQEQLSGFVQGLHHDETLEWSLLGGGNRDAVTLRNVAGPFGGAAVAALALNVTCVASEDEVVQASYNVRWHEGLELNQVLPLVLRGFSRAPAAAASNADWSVALEVYSVNLDRYETKLTVDFQGDGWQYASGLWQADRPSLARARVVVRAPCAHRKDAVAVFTFLGLFAEPKLACTCDAAHYLKVVAKPRCTYCSASDWCLGSVRYRCAPGTFSYGGSTSCEPCPIGALCTNGFISVCEVSNDFHNDIEGGGECNTECPSGHACAAGLASVCAVGRYAPLRRTADQKHNCIPCDPGKYSPTTGAKECAACQGGKTSNLGSAVCFDCSAGEASLTGQAPCGSCPVGKWSSAGAGECTDCAAGRFADEEATNTACNVCVGSAQGAATCG